VPQGRVDITAVEAVESEWERGKLMRASWLAPLIALLMGCLVGGYSIEMSFYDKAGVVVSALALALPALISVVVDPAISRRGLVVTGVVATALLVGGGVIGRIAYPAVWQGYSSNAAPISLLAEMLLTPFVAAFVASSLRTRAADNGWAARAIVYGLLAWAGVGFQSILLTYVIPIGQVFLASTLFHQSLPTDRGGFAYGWVFDLIFVFILLALYVGGFGYAVLLGFSGGALRRRLSRPSR
jgi:hypothetical protein